MMQYNQEQISNVVKTAIAESLRISPTDIKMDSGLGDELGADSLDFVDIHFRLQSNFNVKFYEGSILDKLSEIFGPDRLVKKGRLTELGAELLRRRMPEIDPSRITAGMHLGVETMYTPATWVRAVKELLEVRPETCSSCGSADLKPVRPSILLCGACGAELACPTQEELITAWAKEMSTSLVDA